MLPVMKTPKDGIIGLVGDGDAVPELVLKKNKWIKIICANICLVMLSHMMYIVYSNAVIRTLERRFALTSSQTGFLQSCNDIIHVLLVVFIGYFSAKSNKPRMMCVTVMFTAMSAFLMSSPHFLLSTYESLHELGRENYTTSSILCQIDAHRNDQCQSNNNLETGGQSKLKNLGIVHPAYYIFVVAQLISGVGSSAIFTLSIAYMDENAPKNRASFYIGIVYSIMSFGPLSGLILGALCLRLPENFLNGVVADTKSTNFIGCWWLGYIITGILLMASGIPLWFYPNKIVETYQLREKDESDNTDVIANRMNQVKAFPTAVKRLFSNKAYTLNLLNILLGAYIVTGVFINIVRYTEIHFAQRAFVGAIIAGLSSALSGAIGSFGGGAMMARFRMKMTGALRFLIISSFILCTCILAMNLIDCTQPVFITEYDLETDQHSVIFDCNMDCGCVTTRLSFHPICSEDGKSYFSPCVAGCKRASNNTYENCTCLRGNATIATDGICRQDCFPKLMMYASALIVFSFAGSFARVPATVISFRLVGDEDKTFALGFNSFIMNLFGFIPAPIIYGYLIDKSCIVWEKTCEVTGTCLVYHPDRLRNSIYGLTFCIELMDLLVVTLVFYMVRRNPVLNILYANSKNQQQENYQVVDQPFDDKYPYANNNIKNPQS